jgi:hypothetical protein
LRVTRPWVLGGRHGSSRSVRACRAKAHAIRSLDYRSGRSTMRNQANFRGQCCRSAWSWSCRSSATPVTSTTLCGRLLTIWGRNSY